MDMPRIALTMGHVRARLPSPTDQGGMLELARGHRATSCPWREPVELHGREPEGAVIPQNASSAPRPLKPGPEDWVITGHVVRENETIILNGNLVVKDGGALTLRNCQLFLNCSRDGEWQIRVEGGGSLSVLDGSVITALDPEHEFLFYVEENATLHMADSELHECGYAWGAEGLTILADGAVLENCTITGNYIGLYCRGEFGYPINITLVNCNMSYNQVASTASTSSRTWRPRTAPSATTASTA